MTVSEGQRVWERFESEIVAAAFDAPAARCPEEGLAM
jgi:hypothetical protein